MRTVKKKRLQFILLLFFLFPAVVFADDPEPMPVLILHSYHPGFIWTDGVMEGMRTGLSKNPRRLDLQVEYLDAKRFPQASVQERFLDLLEEKTRGRKYAVVLVSDNIGLVTAIRVRPALFPGVPIVFCGFNGPPDNLVRGQKGITGVLETWDPVGTIELALQLQPGLNELYALYDYTESGLGTRADLEKVIPVYEDRIRFRFAGNLPVDAIVKEISSLPNTTAVLLMGYNVDSKGVVFDSAATGPYFAERANVPVYTMDQTRFSGGVMGGSLLSGKKQGETAGELAVFIINGQSADSFPIMREPVAMKAVDYAALKRFGIDPARVPSDHEVLGRPVSFFDVYRYQILAVLAAFFVLTLFAVFMALQAALRRKAEKRAVEREEDMRTLLNSIKEGIIEVNDSGVVREVNPVAAALMGVASGEAKGMPLGDILKLSVVPTGNEAANQTRKPSCGLPSDGLYTVMDGQGREATISFSSSNIRETGDHPGGSVIVLRDVSEELRLQERLNQSQRLEAVGQLAGGIAHDFNNILTVIIGSIEILIQSVDNIEDVRVLARQMKKATSRAADLTKHLLAFSRKGKLRMIQVQIHRIIEEVVLLLSRSIDKGISIVTDFSAQSDVVMGDPSLIQSALLNLGINARDAITDRGEIGFSTELIIGYGQKDAAGPTVRYLRVRVKDTGTGMSDEVRSHIFEPFFTTKQQGEGTGLGLAAVYGCMQSHNGSVTVQSEPGNGTCFNLEFPLADTTADTVEPAEAEIPGKPDKPGRSLSILLIDDEEGVGVVTARLLGSMGHKVVLHTDPSSGLKAFRSKTENYDLVIIDLIMPQMSGRELFFKLRESDPGVKVLLFSGYSNPGSVEELLGAGAAGFLPKPFTLPAMKTIIEQVMGQAGV